MRGCGWAWGQPPDPRSRISSFSLQVYEHLGRPIAPDSEFDRFLAKTQKKQETHKKTKTDESHLTQAEIRTEFPDLFKEILSVPGMHSVHAGLTPVSGRPTPSPSPSPSPSPFAAARRGE